VGGTLTAAALAYMAQDGDRRVADATLLTTQVDFTHAGDLKVFADEGQIAAVEEIMARFGYLPGAKMAAAFNMLRPQDLIWPYVVETYVKGKSPKPFDLLFWNADSTRMAGANHSFYLRGCYLENRLAQGRMVIGGRTLDLKSITLPIYTLATREDHIAPARSVLRGSTLFGGPMTYVLAGSGHIAGVVNHPARRKYQHWISPAPLERFADGDLDAWLATAEERSGSWWPHWRTWLGMLAPETTAARSVGSPERPPIADAPGSYVREGA
jgi:polyhydroxyalkanoate synthase